MPNISNFDLCNEDFVFVHTGYISVSIFLSKWNLQQRWWSQLGDHTKKKNQRLAHKLIKISQFEESYNEEWNSLKF